MWALCTFRQQLALKIRVRCEISIAIVLLQTYLYCGFRDKLLVMI